MGKKEKQARRFPFKVVFVMAVCVFALLMLMISPLFDVQHVTVEGNAVVATDTILETAGLKEPVNIFSVMSGQTAKKLNAIPYIKSARIVKEYPNSIRVVVEERTARGHVELAHMDTYLLVDGEGMVLGTQTAWTDKLPVIIGLDFSEFAVGHILETQNPEAFDTMVRLSQLFVKNEMEGVAKVDVSDNKDIHVYIQNVDVLFGSMDYADVKVQILRELAANHIPADYRGFLDMRAVTDASDIEKIPLRPLQ